MKNADRLVDVLQCVNAAIGKRHIEVSVHLVMNFMRNADAAGLAFLFKTRGNVYPVAIKVIAVDHHIAQIDADAKPHALRFR